MLISHSCNFAHESDITAYFQKKYSNAFVHCISDKNQLNISVQGGISPQYRRIIREKTFGDIWPRPVLFFNKANSEDILRFIEYKLLHINSAEDRRPSQTFRKFFL